MGGLVEIVESLREFQGAAWGKRQKNLGGSSKSGIFSTKSFYDGLDIVSSSS